MVKKITIHPAAKKAEKTTDDHSMPGPGTYAITICPSDKYQAWDSILDDSNQRFKSFIKGVASQIGQLNNSHIILYPEVSKGGRLHYHGTITYTNPAAFYIEDYQNLKRLGIIDIDTIESPGIWKIYCTKDKQYMKPYCKQKKLPYKLKRTSPDLAKA